MLMLDDLFSHWASWVFRVLYNYIKSCFLKWVLLVLRTGFL